MTPTEMQEYVMLSNHIMTVQGMKIQMLLGLLETIIMYGKAKNDVKLGAMLEKTLNAYNSTNDGLKEKLERMKQLVNGEQK